MAKATVEVLVDDLDGSDAVETVRLGWNGDWREIELSEKNLAALSRALDKYWNVGRPVSVDGQPRRRSRPKAASSRRLRSATHDSKRIRDWAANSGIVVGARGRVPAEVVHQYREAHRRS
jgi:nucleoid-associated protein Lsr2